MRTPGVPLERAKKDKVYKSAGMEGKIGENRARKAKKLMGNEKHETKDQKFSPAAPLQLQTDLCFLIPSVSVADFYFKVFTSG